MKVILIISSLVVIKASPLFDAILQREAETVRGLLKSCDVNNEFGIDGRTPLIAAASTGNYEMVRILVEEGHAELNGIGLDLYNSSPFSAAIQSKNVAVVRFLVEKGANPNERGRHFFEKPALSVALSLNSMDVVNYLLNIAEVDVDMKDSSGKTALFEAARDPTGEISRILLEDRNAEANVVDIFGNTPFFSAILYGNVPMARHLVAANGDALRCSRGHFTALHLAVQYGINNFREMAIFLVKETRLDVDVMDEVGRTSLCLASETHQIKSMNILLELGADVNSRDHLGCNILYKVMDFSHPWFVLDNFYRVDNDYDPEEHNILVEFHYEAKMEAALTLIAQGAVYDTNERCMRGRKILEVLLSKNNRWEKIKLMQYVDKFSPPTGEQPLGKFFKLLLLSEIPRNPTPEESFHRYYREIFQSFTGEEVKASLKTCGVDEAIRMFETFGFQDRYYFAKRNYELARRIPYRQTPMIGVINEKMFQIYYEWNKVAFASTYLKMMPLDLMRDLFEHLNENLLDDLHDRAHTLEALIITGNDIISGRTIGYETPDAEFAPFIGDLIHRIKPLILAEMECKSTTTIPTNKYKIGNFFIRIKKFCALLRDLFTT